MREAVKPRKLRKYDGNDTRLTCLQVKWLAIERGQGQVSEDAHEGEEPGGPWSS